MNKIVLTKKIDLEDTSDEKYKFFVYMGELNKPLVEKKAIDTLYSTGLLEVKDLVLKYNGIEMKLKTQDVPKIIKALCKVDILIYGIHQIYDPDF